MIDIIVSEACPHCDTQKSIMKEAFYSDEYRIIHVGSSEFEKLEVDLKESVDAVPYIVVRNEDGQIKHATKGNLEAIKLRRILNSEMSTFNLSAFRQQAAS